MVSVIEQLAAANWQRAGKKGGPKPKPIRRPNEPTVKRIAPQARTVEEYDKILGPSWVPPRN